LTVERLNPDGTGFPRAKRLRADADKRPEKSLIAECVGRTRAAERWGRSQTANGRSQRGRGNPSNQSLFDTHSRLCVAIELLSNWRPAASRINPLERSWRRSEGGSDGGGGHHHPALHAIRSGAARLANGPHHFVIFYLLVHGLLKLGIAVALLRGTARWVFPVASLILTGFIAYMSWRLSLHWSDWLLGAALFDLLTLGLVLNEWRAHDGGNSRFTRAGKAAA